MVKYYRETELHGVATSGNYNTLNNKPDIPSKISDLSNDVGFITSTSLTWSNIIGKPSFHAVATSGNYNDLSNRPTIPTALSQLSNDPGYITSGGRAYPRRADGTDMNFYWSGQSGQPTWLWGSNDGVNHYVWNPSNFSVNYANSANTANSATNATNATNGRYVYDNGSYSGSAGYKEASNMHVYYAYLGRLVYNNGAYSGGPSWVEPSDLGVRYANSANTANSATNATNSTYGRYVYNNGAYSGGPAYVEPSDLGVRYANSAGGAPWSGISSKPSNLTFWDTWYGSAYLGSNGDLYMGWAGAWTSSWFNQSVRSDATPTFSTVYTSNWFRSYGATGWYNQSYGGGVYMEDGSYVRTYGSKHFYVDQNIYAAGDIIGFSSTPSDIRLKKNLKRITGASGLVRQLSGYYFDWKNNNKHDIGLKAQDVEKVLPEVVSETKLPFYSTKGENDETKYKVVQYEKIVAVLIEAQKEQMDRIDLLTKRIEQLEKENKTLIKKTKK